jgi:hypothetical protein
MAETATYQINAWRASELEPGGYWEVRWRAFGRPVVEALEGEPC